MNSLDLIVFDMDGTLLQSTSAVPDSFIETAANFGYPGYSRAQIVECYRLGVPENVVAHLLGQEPSAQQMDFFYNTLADKAGVVSAYSGIVETLEALAPQIDVAVFTGASSRSASILLNETQLAHYFKHIEGGDSHPPKPDPGGIVTVAETFGYPLGRVAYVGDAPYDMEAAFSAGVMGLAAGWGHLFEQKIPQCTVLDTPADLLNWVCV